MWHRLRFVVGVMGWLLILVVGTTVTGRFRPDLVVVGGALGLLGLAELATPTSVRPEWQRRLRVVLFAAVLLSLVVIAPRVYDLVTY